MHTPGPWRATRDTDTRGNHCWRIDSPTVSLIAVLTYSTAGERAEGIDDACLIETAPDLLAHARLTVSPEILTLRAMCKEGSDVADILDAIIASGQKVIKKATYRD